MTKKAEFVQLEAGEDVNSVRDRLSFIRGQHVLIIWPEDGTALLRKLDLVLLQREAMCRAVRLALVTHDPQVIEYAKELNISTFETIGASERGRWKRGRGKVFISRFQRPKDEPEPDELKEVASRVLTSDEPVSKVRRMIVRGVVLGLLLAVLAAVGYVVVPSATITLILAQTRIEVDTQLIANPKSAALDVENGIIPATTLRVEIESSGTIQTTGTRESADVPAKGSVIFINQTNREIAIAAGTTVGTSAGTPILFRTTQDAKLAKGVGQQLEVPIEALPSAAGAVGNVDTGLINTVIGPLERDVTVRNIAPITGGDSRALPAVTTEDRDRLLATVRQQIQAQAYTAMQASVSATQFIVIETLHVAEERADWTNFSAKPGDIADTLSLTMRAIVEAVAIDQQLAQQVAFTQMGKKTPRGRELKLDTLTYDCCALVGMDGEGRVTLKVSGSGLVAGQVNVGMLQERLAGRSKDAAFRYLMTEVDIAAGSSPEVSLSPDWFGQMPILPIRITVILQEPA